MATTTTITRNIQRDIILEYREDSHCHTMICDSNKKERYIASEVNKWLFPNKIYSITTGIRLYFPKNSIGILTRCPWLHPNLEIIPQVINDDSFVVIQIRNTGLLPIKICEEEILASLHIIPKLECHVVQIKND